MSEPPLAAVKSHLHICIAERAPEEYPILGRHIVIVWVRLTRLRIRFDPVRRAAFADEEPE
jgi:hypothetical protein